MIARCHDCADTYLAEAELEVLRCEFSGWRGHVLDVGCGPSARCRTALPPAATYVGVDWYLDEEDLPDRCHKINGETLSTFEGGSFGAVVMCRALCQNSPLARKHMLGAARRVLCQQGRFCFLGPVQEYRTSMNRLREAQGLPPLPAPKSGGRIVSLEEIASEFHVLKDKAIAPEYVLWTRFTHEALTGEPPRMNSPLAQFPPCVENEKLADSVCFYRFIEGTPR